MTAVGLGQQRSQAVGLGFESSSCYFFTVYPYHFLMPETSETLKGSFTMYFGTVRQKISTENLDTPPSPLIHKLFRYRKFSETQRRRFQLWNFWALWDKRFSTENLDAPLIHKLFRYRKFSETQQRRVHLGNFSAMWDKKNSTENLDNPLPPPPLIHKLFRSRKFSETQHRRVPLRNISVL